MKQRTRPTERQAEEHIASELGISRSDLWKLARRERARDKAESMARILRVLLARADECCHITGHPAALCAEARDLLDELDGQRRIPLVKLGQGEYQQEIIG